MTNDNPPGSDGPRRDSPRFAPEQIEEGRRYGLELDPAKCIDGSEFIRNLIAELEAEPGTDR